MTSRHNEANAALKTIAFPTDDYSVMPLLDLLPTLSGPALLIVALGLLLHLARAVPAIIDACRRQSAHRELLSQLPQLTTLADTSPEVAVELIASVSLAKLPAKPKPPPPGQIIDVSQPRPTLTPSSSRSEL